MHCCIRNVDSRFLGFQAIYNVLVSALFCLLAWAVYYVVLVVLEPFLVPLFWAVLTGFVIHPYKTKFADVLRKWIANFDNHEKPVAISSFLGCLATFDWGCESIGSKILSKWKLVVAIGIALPIYHFVTFYPLDVTTPSLIFKAWHAFKFIEFITWPMLVSCMSTYCISVVFLWSEERQRIFQITGVVVWSLCALYVINLFWPPLWMLGSILALVYAFTKISKFLELEEKTEDETDSRQSKQIRFRQAVLTILNRMNSTYGNIMTDHPDGGARNAYPSASSTPNINRIEKIEHPGVSALKKPFVSRKIPDTPGMITDTPLSSSRLGGGGITNMKLYRTAILKRSSSIELGTSQESNSYIKIVLWSCLVVQLFIRPFLLHFLPIPISYALLKKFWTKISTEFSSILESLRSRVSEFLKSRKQAFLPWPVDKIASELYKIERSFIRTIPNFVDTIVTILLILGIIVGLVMTVIFVSAQMYSETVYIVQTSSKLVTSVTSSSFFQQLNESLGVHNQQYFKGGLEDVMDSGYRYGRQYISSSVVSIFKNENNDNQDSVDEFETKLLELWDRIYQYWLSQNITVTSQKSPNVVEYGPQVSQEAITTSMEEVIHRVLAILDLSAFGQFTLNNTGTLISILDQGWSLLKGNLSFALTIISEILRILFHSGSGMVNFLLSMIVYFTALFYLLSSSGNVYRPVEMISQYSGMVMGTGFASALNKAINSVFTVTFKMATFYGLWTYLTHTVFSASIKTVPVLVATFLATVPVAGQYLVALPAALELWLVEERSISALALLLCHFLPTYVIDAAIYAEVRQGIHPWITGLSIVGGVYYFGITGAIYGPLFLCGMYVILSVYTGWLQDIPLETNKSKAQQQPMVTPVIKRSESVY